MPPYIRISRYVSTALLVDSSTALAEYVYKQGGYVGGAVYNEDWSVSQFLSADKTDLPRLRSSKYLQSRFDGFLYRCS